MREETSEPGLLAQRRSLFWRVHFWAALIATPFALVATLTGMLYIFTPQIEQALYGHLERVAPGPRTVSLDQAVAAAQAAAPAGMAVHSVLPPYRAQDAVKVSLAAPGGGGGGHGAHSDSAKAPASTPAFGLPARSVVVYVDPYSSRVLGAMAPQERFGNWAKQLHSRLLQGDAWRWMIELAASWLLVMLLTGVWLAWPGNGRRLLPQAGVKGRARWRQWHAFLGIALALVSLVILTTGLTWSKYAGGQIREARNAAGQAPPAVPQHLQSGHPDSTAMLGWQSAWDATRALAPDVAVGLTAPRGMHGVWKASAADPAQPLKRFDLLLDAYSGKPLYLAGWDRQTTFSQATAIGIPFHRGEFGWWNQVLLLVFGLGLLFSLVSGWVMVFKRQRRRWYAPPRLLPGAWRSPSPLYWIATVAMLVMMPLLALSAALILAIEIAIGAATGRRNALR